MENDPSVSFAIANLPRPGALVDGQFKITRELGQGSFGVVFEATDLTLERTVAIKMLKPQCILISGATERFQREARLASALQSLHTVRVFHFGTWSPRPNLTGLPYIVMERLNGESLDLTLQRQIRLSIHDTFAIVRQVLLSLSEAHERGIIHRDMKPENLFIIERDGQTIVKVLDFGIARAVSGDWSADTLQRLTRTGIICGTPAFMAPEQATGTRDLTASVDVYAVGCLAFLLVTGKLPFQGDSPTTMAYNHISGPIPTLPAPLDKTPLNAVLQHAMAKAPHQRFRDARAFLAELDDCIAATPELFAPNAPPLDLDDAPAAALVRAPTLEFYPGQRTDRFESDAPVATTANTPGNPTVLTTAIAPRPQPSPLRHPVSLLLIASALAIAIAVPLVLLFNTHAPPTAQFPEPPTTPTDPTPLTVPEPEPEPEPTPEPTPEAPAPASPSPHNTPAPARRRAPTVATPVPTGAARGRLAIVCTQADLVVYIDGGGPYPCNRTTTLAPGDYAVRAHARGQELHRVVHLDTHRDTKVFLSIP